MKLLPPIIEQYKKRFLVPIRNKWLEESIAGLKMEYDPMKPLIIFSNGEKLTYKDCLENNPSYEKSLPNEITFSMTFNFRKSKPDDLPILFNEDEFEDDEPDIITQTLIFEESGDYS